MQLARHSAKNIDESVYIRREPKEQVYELELLQTLMDSIPDAIYFKDTTSRFIRINRAHAKRMGLNEPREAIGKTDFDFYPEKFALETYADEQNIVKTGKALIGKIEKIEKPNGQFRWISATKVPIKDKKGNIKGVAGISRDITEYKKTEEEMRIKDNAIESSINAVGFANLKGSITYVNRSFLEMWGYQDKKEILGKPMPSFWKTPENAIKVMQALMKSGGWIGELSALRKDGSTFDAQLSASVITDDHGNPICFMASFVDITEGKKMFKALKEANSMLEWLLQNLKDVNERLQQSNDDLENYTYAVSHDLKAPLRAIRSFSTFLMEDYGNRLDEVGQDYLKRIADASSHMDHLIEDLLLLSRVGRKFMKVEKVNLNQLSSEIEADLKPLIKVHNAEVVFNELPTIFVQRTWMKQILMNLIDNGLKFNKSKTPRVEVLYEERKKDYLFKVRDNGVGIERKYFERIFRLFERLHTEDEYEGTGAGLAICKRIVEHWGGKIWVESTPNKGSTFLFTVPKKGKTNKKKAIENDTE